MSPQSPQDRRHEENRAAIAGAGERLVKLEVEVKHIGVDVADLKVAVKEAMLEMKQESAKNLSDFKEEVKPLIEAFKAAKGVRAAAVILLVVVFGILGAAWREIGGWLLGSIKP